MNFDATVLIPRLLTLQGSSLADIPMFLGALYIKLLSPLFYMCFFLFALNFLVRYIEMVLSGGEKPIPILLMIGQLFTVLLLLRGFPVIYDYLFSSINWFASLIFDQNDP